MISHLFSKERIIAKEGFNRWWVPPASMGIHLCIGSVYAWSIFNPPLVKTLGVVSSAADDWELGQVVWIFTVAIVFLGLAAAFAGRWLERVGPRLVGSIAALLWGGGFIIGSIGIHLHILPIVYLGYGVIGGCGLGLGYVSPVSTLIRWFPDRRGMATGMAIMGFGGGAIIAAPLKEFLIKTFYKAPEYLGPVDGITLVTHAGRRFAETANGLLEVVVLGAGDLANLTLPAAEGVYVVGTGSSGVAQTFLTLGIVYLVIMLIAAFSYRIPAEGWQPAGWQAPDADTSQNKMISQNHVDVNQALKTPQFYQLWIVLCFNVTAGIGVIGIAKTMMTDIFSSSLPNIVDGTFAATYVLMISVFNMLGRFVWASLSDYLGRKRTYWMFFAVGILLYLSIPYSASQVSANPGVVWLVLFYAATMTIFTFYGGGFATIPAYLADVFGTRHVGAIHGRLLTAWSTAGVLGPLAITSFRKDSINDAIHELANKVDPSRFKEQYGVGIDHLQELIQSKTVTISNLLEISPLGTIDPTPSVYNSVMYVMAALLLVALISNALMRPVHSKHHYKSS